MKRNSRLKFLSIICVLSFILSSCNSGIDLSVVDDPSIKIDGSLAIPIGEANLTVKDVIEKIGLPTGVDTVASEIYLQWAFTDEMGFKTLNLADSIKPFDRTYKPADYMPAAYIGILTPINPNPPIEIKIDDFFDLGINENVDEQHVDSIKVNSSQVDINFDVSNDIKQQLLVSPRDFTIQFIFEEKYIKVDDGQIPTYNPNQYNEDGKIQIGKYSMYTINGLKKLPYSILIKLNPNARIKFVDSSYVKFHMKFSNIDFAVAYGFFDLTEIEQKQVRIPFNIEDYLPKMDLKFANPMVQITATTNVGADLNIKVNYISAYNDSNPANRIWAWFDGHKTNEKTEQITGPTKVGEWTTKAFEEFDSKNGETDQLFDNKPYPNMLDYMYEVSSDRSLTNNFITPDSKVKLDIKVNIPLKIKGGTTYSFSDTIENLNFETLPENVDSAILVLKIKNRLPLKANYRMTFHKSNSANDTIPAIGGIITKVSDESTLGNMTSEYVVHAPEVDSEGTVTYIEPMSIIPQTIKILLNKNQIAELKQTHFIVFHVTLDSEKEVVKGVETSRLNAIHITTNNSFAVKLGIFLMGSFNNNAATSN